MLHTFHRVEGSLNWQSANSLSFFVALKYLPDTDNCSNSTPLPLF